MSMRAMGPVPVRLRRLCQSNCKLIPLTVLRQSRSCSHSRGISSTSLNQEESYSPSSQTSTDTDDRSRKTSEYLYGPQSGWRKPAIPKKPATPPKKRPKVDPMAFMELPPLPIPPTSLKLKIREKVEYSLAEGQSNERRAFFSNLDGAEENELGNLGGGLEAEMGDEVAGLEIGRVVECRRSGMTSVGLILANLVVSGRPRLLLLRSSGEIWPVSSHDVQFVMPSSLIPPQLTEACWSPSLLQAWAESDAQAGLNADAEGEVVVSEKMMDARRKVAMVLRKVQRETEKMCGRLAGGYVTGNGKAGGVEAVYDHWASKSDDERTSVTAVEAAEYLLNPSTPQDGETPITVRPNTLPAYAAHQMLMQRPDLFTADQRDMWATGIFLVRSRKERRTIEKVQYWVESTDPEIRKPLDNFIVKAKKAIDISRSLKQETMDQSLKEHKHDLEPWTEDDLKIISVLFAPLIETRSTQTPITLSVAYSITRLILPSPSPLAASSSDEAVIVERGVLAHMLQDIGLILPWDSLETSKVNETTQRSQAMASSSSISGQVRSSDDLLNGNELDHLREDYTNHRVFVIDDPSASELDDGISLERIKGEEEESYWVHIHIADPTRFIAPDHHLAHQASFRGSALYLPEGNIPLFPLDETPKLKELSLGAEVKDGMQGTLTFSAKISKEGTVKDTKIKMGWIKKPKIITYTAVDEALGIAPSTSTSTRPFGSPLLSNNASTRKTTPISSEELEDLKILYNLAKSHRASRYSHAGLEWSFPSASPTLHLQQHSLPNANIFDSNFLPSTPQIYSGSIIQSIDFKVSTGSPPTLNSSTLVAEYMILAGRIAASFCSSRSIPISYRGSSSPKPLKSSSLTYREDFVNDLERLLSQREKGTGWIDGYVLRNKSRNWYTPSGNVALHPLEHWVMGLVPAHSGTQDLGIGYTRVTSPLRRFEDMIAHWQIKSYLAREAGDTFMSLNERDVEVLGKRAEVATVINKRSGKIAENFWSNKVINHHLTSPSPSSHTTTTTTTAGSEGRVDLKHPIKAKISGQTISSIKGEITIVNLEQLGLVNAKMIHQSKQEWEMGQQVDVIVEHVGLWPNPVVTVRLVE